MRPNCSKLMIWSRIIDTSILFTFVSILIALIGLSFQKPFKFVCNYTIHMCMMRENLPVLLLLRSIFL